MQDSGELGPTRLHVEPKLLPIGIVSLIGIPTALVGKLIAFENFVAELVEHSALVSRHCCNGQAQRAERGFVPPL